jgi:hypothetical protein
MKKAGMTPLKIKKKKWSGQFATTVPGFTAQISYKTFPYLQPVDLSFMQ